MICDYLAKTRKTIANDLILETIYTPPPLNPPHIHGLSSVAQRIFREQCPQTSRFVRADQPEIIALRLLDFFSSKQGFIRRKGHTFRTDSFYRKSLPLFVRAIRQGKPLRFSTLCFCTTLANTKFGGESPYPHMASYIALENVHKIAQGAAKIYAPGVRFFLGFEGRLFQPLYFHNDTVLENTFAVLKELNEEAYKNVSGGKGVNAVEIVDALWMIEKAFGTYDAFVEQVEEHKEHVRPEDVLIWQEWYKKTVSGFYFPSTRAKNRFIDEQAKWRNAVYVLKNNGGRFGGGLLCFDRDIIQFTPSGRRSDMLALQLVPENSFLPHQRIITHESETNRWRMKAYEDIRKAKDAYAPRYIEKYSYPFYFEKVEAERQPSLAAVRR